jgi:hypothetical protein
MKVAISSVPIDGGENYVKSWTGMVHLSRGDVREARTRA